MPVWNKTKLPDDYLAVFHTPFTEGPGMFVIKSSYKEEDVRREGKRFNSFKAALRRNPHHATALRYAKMDTRLEYRCLDGVLWEAVVTTRWKIGIAELVANKVFGEDMQNAIDTLERTS